MRWPRSPQRPLVFAGSIAVATILAGSWAAGTGPALESAPVAPTAATPTFEAARALRAGDCDRAAELLKKSTGAVSGESLEDSVLQGLYAHECQRYSTSLEHLRVAEGYVGPLADWRLSSLASSAVQLGQMELARVHLHRLVREYPDSPLRARSLVRAAELALEADDLAMARQLVDKGRREPLAEDLDLRLETVAWNLAPAMLDEDLERSAARNLLVRHPLTAAELKTVEVFRPPSGELEWSRFLSPAEIVERSRSLLAAELPERAAELLEHTLDNERDFEWTLLMGEVLTAGHRGVEALPLLDTAVAQTQSDTVRLEWQRARAALEASRARKGRTLDTDGRRQMRVRAHRHLRRLLGMGPEPALAIRALRILFSDLADAERFDESLDVLRALQRIDPEDTTGTRYLWRNGWSEFEKRNYSGAIGYWTELGRLYPESNYTRAGLYWSARAHRALGNDARAEEMLRQIARGDYPDFYRLHALQRVDVAEATPTTTEVETTEWPDDPLLERSRLLTDIGLDEAALIELELLASDAEPKAASALRSQILANQGRVRDSIVSLLRAFPELGTPAEGRAPERARSLYYPLEYSDVIQRHARRQSLPPHLVFGMIRQESAFDASARSWAGARGLMQVMPATGRELAQQMGLKYTRERLSDPGFSVQLGTAYFRQVMRMFEGNEQLALAGYNAGPYRIKRLWRQAGARPELDRFLENLPLDETRIYVKRVMFYSGRYHDIFDAES